jgi:hypothetical protein
MRSRQGFLHTVHYRKARRARRAAILGARRALRVRACVRVCGALSALAARQGALNRKPRSWPKHASGVDSAVLGLAVGAKA